MNFIRKIIEDLKNIHGKYEFYNWDKPLRCKTFYFLPQLKLHSSGYRMIKIIAITDDNKKYIKTVCSDVLHFKINPNVKVAYDDYLAEKPFLKNIFNIDVTLGGITRFFIWHEAQCEFKLGSALSSFDIEIINKEDKC